ncbi:hypothetical protein GCM10010439_62500 [Actinocorallia aurantiaca]|uniref:Mycofactocin n=1 Tax=Actinocorallia aurantiaca TaxID=46204 RepID=A0ABP6H7B1_9ACTN
MHLVFPTSAGVKHLSPAAAPDEKETPMGETHALPVSGDQAEDAVVESLIEEVSIDGMCGVY